LQKTIFYTVFTQIPVEPIIFTAFANNPSLITTNPFFGDLNFEENVYLLHKHALHHLN